MKVQEIKKAVDEGKLVHWSSEGYTVVKNNNDYDIFCLSNNHRIGLTWVDGESLNGKEEDFYLSKL
jgi:hypothetical protein